MTDAKHLEPTVPEQASSAGSIEPAAPSHGIDPLNRAAMVAALQKSLASAGVRSKQYPPTAKGSSYGVLTAGGGMTQMIALKPDDERDGHYAWYWLWADGLRGEGPITTERACDGEDISTACTKIARVLGVRPVAV